MPYQLQNLYSFELVESVIMNDKYVRIWKDSIVPYTNEFSQRLNKPKEVG